jgi:hypothetical protein
MELVVDDGKPAAAALDQLHQAFELDQRVAVQVMGLIDEEHHRLLVLAHQVTKLAFALLAARNADLLLGGQVVEQRSDQGGELDAAFLDRQRLRDRDLALLVQDLLQPSQQHGLAAADHTTDRNQAALVDGTAHILHQLFVVPGLVVPGLIERHAQTKMLHYFNPHAALPVDVGNTLAPERGPPGASASRQGPGR